MSVESPEPARPAVAAAPTAVPASASDDGLAQGNPEPMEEGWWRWMRSQLRREPGLAITLSYLAVSLLGVWASYWFFRSFDIAILGYMSPADYLTAGLRDPVYLLITAGAFALTLLLNFHEYARVRGRDYHAAIRARWWGLFLLPFPYRPAREHWVQRFTGWRGLSLPTGLLFGMVWATMWLTMLYVDSKAQGIKNGGGDRVRVTLSSSEQPLPGTARMLGSVGEFVFLYWPQTGRSEAVSVEHVGRMESVHPAQPAKPQPPVPAKPASSPAPRPRQPGS